MNFIWDITAGELGQIIGVSAGIGLSLYFSFRALNQTKVLQEKEHRQKLLNEIIEWASNIAVSASGFISDISTKEELNAYLALHTKSEYVKSIAGSFDDKMSSSINNVVFYVRVGGKLIFDTLKLTSIEQQLKVLNPWLERNEYIDKANSTLPKVRFSIMQSAIELMQVAARIKSKNI